jgi:serine/threonine-protein kinase
MGEVYEATDINLSRQVAVKVLPEAVATDADRLARFDREAKTLASLNHPNIAAIHGLERTGGITALVMEFVDGPTLADRLLEGPIPIDEALDIARQIAEAVEAAHGHGIIHRDLKPANVKLRPDGRVKVLDFGLAKAVDQSGAIQHSLSLSPTITTPAMTQAGVILGTAAYMSPEQARGKPVDKRADVWAFGCVFFEMLSGVRAFRADEISDTLAFVLTRDPDWSALPPATPPAARRLLRRCLVKDVKGRLSDIGSARLEIEDARVEHASPPADADAAGGVAPRRTTRLFLAALTTAAVVTLSAIAVWTFTRSPRAVQPVTRALIGVAPAERLLSGIADDASMGQGRPSRTALAFAPDGRSIVFSAERKGQVQLYVRRLDQLEATPIAGTEGASNPFFSPTGESLGFYAGGALKRVPLAGGPVVTVCEVALVFGASWARDDQIVFATQMGGLWAVSASGGKPTVITKLQSDEYSHRLPQFLPDGKAIVFTSTKEPFPTWEDTRVVVQSLTTGAQKVLIEGGADARYISTGHLIYMRRGTLMAVPFDADRLELSGSSVGLVAEVMQAANIQPIQIDSGAGQFAVSNAGSLAYVTGGVYPQDRWSLAWVNRDGKSEPLNIPRGSYLAPRVSPDGKRVAFGTSAGDWDLMVYDVSRQLVARLPMSDQQSVPVWTPDSAKVVFASGLSGTGKLFMRSADGDGTVEPLAISNIEKVGITGVSPFANAWTPDGGSLVFWARGQLWLLPREEKAEPRSLFTDSVGALQAEFSPDGRWLVYTSGRGPGQNQVYVRPYPALDRREQVSGANSHSPVWRGRELFYLESAPGDESRKIRVMAVPVTTTPAFSMGKPKVLFEGAFRIDGPFRGYDVTQDGQRFLMVQAIEQPPERISQMVLVQNWVEELKARVPRTR